ncbi:MAG: hypothetical protein ACLP01_28565, partial [Solirubrobacteraceae bacterium]
MATLAVLSLSAAAGGTFAAPSYAQTETSQLTPIAFQGLQTANCSSLWTWNGLPGERSADASPGFNPCVGVAAGTSPSEVALADGETFIAFQGTNGDLFTWGGYPGGTGTTIDRHLGMMQGTSPSIAVLANGAATVAFQGNNGVLWTWVGNPFSIGAGGPTPVAMAPNTSPSEVVDTLNFVHIAVQGTNGDLWTWVGDGSPPGGTNVGIDQHLGMMPGTSPSITSFPATQTGGCCTYAFAFQANTGILWTDVNGVGVNLRLPMAAGTSPSITTVAGGGGDEIAFQANYGNLATWGSNSGLSSGVERNTGLHMASGTSPSITALADGSAAVAIQAKNGVLWSWYGVAGTTGIGAASGCASACPGGGLAMASATSPSIAAAILPPQGLSLTAKGNVLAQLRK